MSERQSTVHGVEDLEKALIGLGGAVGGKALRGAGMDAMKIVEQDQLANAPVGDRARTVKGKGGSKVEIRPGFLKSRIKRRSQLRFTRGGKVRKGFGKGETLRVMVGVFRVLYAYFLEFGTAVMAAQPFIRKSLEQNQSKVISEFSARLRLRINNAARRLHKKRKR